MNDMPSSVAVRVSLLTPQGRGALAVVGVAGRGACELVDACFHPRGGKPVAHRADAAICFGRWGGAGGPGEDLVVVRYAADHVEVHCHGGHAAAEEVLASLEKIGATRHLWPQWLRGIGMDPIEVEAREAVCHVAGARAARILIRQASGLLKDELARIASLPRPGRSAPSERLLAAARVGLRLVDPWRVVLIGPVNAGKSSLANALAGYSRSMVSPEPGTTRDVVTTRLVLGGFDVELMDAAGIRERGAATTPTEHAGIARAMEAAASADLVLRIAAIDEPSFMPVTTMAPTLAVVTKADLAVDGTVVPEGAIVTSALSGRGIAELAAAIVARLVPEAAEDPGLLDGPVPFTLRQVAWIRTEFLDGRTRA